MKQFARKQAPLSLVPTTPERQETARQSLNEFLDTWLTSVHPALTSPTRAKTVFRKLPLTTTDVIQVNRATVRESLDHRHWPPDVVLSFMRADVIKRKKTSA